jgi:hypothetical protein
MRRVFLCALGALIFVGLISASALANPLDASQGPWSPAWCRSEQSVSAPAGLGSADWEQISGQILAAREAARLSGPATTEAISLLPQSFGGLVQQAYLKASNAESNDYMGFSVAIDGDTVVVGAPDENSSATGVNGNQADNTCFRSGAAYVFVRSGTTWTQQAYLKASNTGSIDDFGVSVAISGDTIIVGARTEDSAATGVNGNQADNSADGAGAAYVFVRSGTTWTQQAYLKASNAAGREFFG